MRLPVNPAVAIRCDATVGSPVDAEQAIPLGLIVSELLTNALRHAYSPGQTGQILVTARQGGGRIEIRVADGGVVPSPGQTRPGKHRRLYARAPDRGDRHNHGGTGRGVEDIVSMPTTVLASDMPLAAGK